MSSSIPEAASTGSDGVVGGSGSSGGEKEKNRGWPKGKKRYPKSPGAPKQPLSGYVHFLNDRREIVRKENPDISFADISKKLAVEWGQVSGSVKQEYVERAEADKERYNKEFAAYQQTQEYKDFMEKGHAADKDHKAPAKKAKKDAATESGAGNSTPGGGGSPSTKKSSKKKIAAALSSAASSAVESGSESQLNSPATSAAAIVASTAAATAFSTSATGITTTTSTTTTNAIIPTKPSQTVDIPIFTEEFLEHNKAKESELRQLRKQASEFEEQNAILQKHVENMRSAISKLELETLQQQESNAALAKHLESLRRLVVSHFAGTHLNPQLRKEPLTIDNVDAYMQDLRKIVLEKPRENEALVAKTKDIASRMNYETLTST